MRIQRYWSLKIILKIVKRKWKLKKMKQYYLVHIINSHGLYIQLNNNCECQYKIEKYKMYTLKDKEISS